MVKSRIIVALFQLVNRYFRKSYTFTLCHVFIHDKHDKAKGRNISKCCNALIVPYFLIHIRMMQMFWL